VQGQVQPLQVHDVPGQFLIGRIPLRGGNIRRAPHTVDSDLAEAVNVVAAAPHLDDLSVVRPAQQGRMRDQRRAPGVFANEVVKQTVRDASLPQQRHGSFVQIEYSERECRQRKYCGRIALVQHSAPCNLVISIGHRPSENIERSIVILTFADVAAIGISQNGGAGSIGIAIGVDASITATVGI